VRVSVGATVSCSVGEEADRRILRRLAKERSGRIGRFERFERFQIRDGAKVDAPPFPPNLTSDAREGLGLGLGLGLSVVHVFGLSRGGPEGGREKARTSRHVLLLRLDVRCSPIEAVGAKDARMCRAVGR